MNDNNSIPIASSVLRCMARWHNIIEFYGKGNQKSIINDKCDFTVKSWYIIGETLFVERMTNDIHIDYKHKTLLNVITKYYNNEVVCDGMIIEKDDKCFYCPWSSIERISKYYKHKVIDVEKQANCNMLRIKLTSTKGECDYTMYKDKKNNEETMFTLREWLKDYNTETNIWLDFSNNEARFCRAKDVVETDGEFHEYATYYVNKVKLSDYRMEPQFILQEPFSVNNNITVKNDIEYNDDREKELHNIIGMMCSEDYQDRFKAEYLQLKMRYNKLHNMIIKYEAGKLNFKPKCDIELLKRQKAAMGQYLYYLEVRAEIENIDLNKCFT